MNEFQLENPLFNVCGLVGTIFIGTGFIMFQFPPKKINSLYGYRTVQSMKTQEKWDFAQNYSAKELMKMGFLLLAASLLVFITSFSESVNLLIGLSLVIAVVIILFFRVEKEIKRRFGK